MPARRRPAVILGATLTPNLPLALASPAGAVADRMGACIAGTKVTATNAAFMADYLGITAARIGIMETLPNGSVANEYSQETIADALGGAGVRLVGSPIYRQSKNTLQRLTYARDRWGRGWAKLMAAEGYNEPQRTGSVDVASKWLAVYGTDGPPPTDIKLIGTTRTKVQMDEIKAAIASLGMTSQIQPIMSAMATKSVFLWSKALGRHAYEPLGNVHCYPGGQSVLKTLVSTSPGVSQLKQLISEIADSLPAGSAGVPTWVTETGYHDLANPVGAHRYTPPEVAAVYWPRGMLEYDLISRQPELYNGNTLGFVFIYEILDDPGAGEGAGTDSDYERNFGLFAVNPANINTPTPKLSAVALAKMIALYKDAPTIAPTDPALSIGLQISLGVGSKIQSSLHYKSNGDILFSMWNDVTIFDPNPVTNPSGDYTMPSAATDINVPVSLPPGRAVTMHRPSRSTFNPTSLGTSGSFNVGVGADAVVLKIAA